MLSDLIDKAMDWTVAPGFTRLGYGVRERTNPRGNVSLEAKSVMVTGANSGLGEATARMLCESGANVHMVVRNPEKGEQAKQRIESHGIGDVVLHICDLSSLESVRKFAADFVASEASLDALVNNAGVLPSARTITEEGFELTFATNVLGPFLLTELLLPVLARADDPRVIWVSSGGMYTEGIHLDDLQLRHREFDGAKFYAHTKRAGVMLTEEWARRAASTGVSFYAMHPGWARTPGVEASLPGFNRIMGPLLRTAEQGADTIVWLVGSDRARDLSGDFWHDRRIRPRHRLSRTRDSAADRRRLFDEVERMVDAGEPAAGQKKPKNS